MPFGNARYGATILGFTNASSCVVTVDSPMFFTTGDVIRIANVVCDTTGPQLNGDYTITNITSNLITIDQDTTSFGVYISGGFMTILEQPNVLNQLSNPFSQGNFYDPLAPWTVFNQARGGGYIPFT